MTIASVGTRGTQTSSAAGTTLARAPSASVAAGRVLICQIAQNGNASTSVADAQGNTWDFLGSGSNSSGTARTDVWLCNVTNALSTSNNVTVTFGSSVTHKSMLLWEFSVDAGNTLEESASPVPNESTGNGFGSVSFSGLPSKQRLYLRALAKQASNTGTITATTNFTSQDLNIRSANNAAAIAQRGEFRINTSMGETSNPTWAVSGNTGNLFVALEEVTPPVVVEGDLDAVGASTVGANSGSTANSAINSAGSASVSVSATRVVPAAISVSSTSTLTLNASRVMVAGTSMAGTSTFTADDASTFPEPEPFIEVLGAELLRFEIVGEFKGATYADADMSAAGLANLTLGAARVLPTLHASAGSAATSLSARAIGTSGLASAGTSAVSLGAARVVPGTVSSSGVGATAFSARAIAQAAAAAAGVATSALQAQATTNGVMSAAGVGATNLSARAIRNASINAAGVGATNLSARGIATTTASASGIGTVSLSGQYTAQAAASAAGSSTVAAESQALKDTAVYTAGSSTAFAPTQVLANGVVGFEGSSQADIGAVEVFLASLTSGGLATYSPSGLALARTIEVTDMERPNEFRGMDRGMGDSSMNVPPDEPMDRPDEHRSMEVTS